MDQSALQRYYNEHIHLPHAFFVQPERFIRQALKRKGDFFATAYNYVEPDSEADSDFIKYSSADFTVKDFRTVDRTCVIIELPDPTMPLHCRLIGCSIKRDGRDPVWRTIELTEHGHFLLCGWTKTHTHLVIREVLPESEECFSRLVDELSSPVMVHVRVCRSKQ